MEWRHEDEFVERVDCSRRVMTCPARWTDVDEECGERRELVGLDAALVPASKLDVELTIRTRRTTADVGHSRDSTVGISRYQPLPENAVAGVLGRQPSLCERPKARNVWELTQTFQNALA